ncbi:MAG: hypothetical protein ACLQDY_19465 [Streptosporangiaceae bacterium]
MTVSYGSQHPSQGSASAELTGPDADAVGVLKRLAAGLAAGLPAAVEYVEGPAVLRLARATANPRDLELTLRAPSALVTAVAGTAVVLSFRLDDGEDTGGVSDVSLLGRLDDTGVARFRSPGIGAVSGMRIRARRSESPRLFISLPELGRHAPAAATAETEVRFRHRVVLASPPLTVTAYETPDKKMSISVEGLAQPEPDTALVVTSQIGDGPVTSWALYLRWSPAAGGVRASLTVGQARAGLRWELDPAPVRLADLPAGILRRSQAAADERSRERIAEILASQE